MKEIEMLETELTLMQDNIKRLRRYVEEDRKWIPQSSSVLGELKHRAITLKTRLSIIQKISTSDLFNYQAQ